MTLTDIILRDMEICRKAQERNAAEMSIDEINREIRRRHNRRRMKKYGEIVCGCLTVMGVVALVIGFIACSGYHWE